MKRRSYVGIVAACILLAGAGIFFLFSQGKPFGCKFNYVNSDFVCKSQPVISKAGYVKLENDIAVFIAKKEQAGSVEQVALYFRDLRNGPTFNINGRENFSPASLLKLPLVMTVMSLQEDMPDILNDNILFQKSALADFDIPPQIEPSGVSLKEGEIYSVKELMKNTVVYSDNDSYYTLVAFLNRVVGDGGNKILQTFQDLGIVDPRNPAEEVVSVQGYASIFRILYNASYLSPEASEQVLSWMADATYIKGLKAGVPEGVKVADKFGERELAGDTKQLHDCGIVFYKHNPYTLCVMSRGTDWDALRATIKEISWMVYEEVDSRKLPQ